VQRKVYTNEYDHPLVYVITAQSTTQITEHRTLFSLTVVTLRNVTASINSHFYKTTE